MNIKTFENGLTLIHKETHANDIIGMVMYLRHGASTDPEEKTGLTNLMMRVLSKGTKTRTSEEIAEEFGLLGAGFTAAAGHDYCIASMQCVRGDVDEALEMYTDVLLHPIFPPEEVDLERQRVLAQIRMGEDQTHVVAGKRFREELFGGHAYGRPIEGYPETLPAIEPQDLYDAHRVQFIPRNMVLSVVGNIDFEDLVSLVEKYLGVVEPVVHPSYSADKVIMPGGRRVPIYKDAQQAFVVMGHLTCPAGHDDEPAIEVASAVLGSGMSSRLFRELRDKQGLAYAVGSQTHFFRQQGYFVSFIGTSPGTAEQAEEGLWSQVKLLRDEPIPEEELQRAKNYISGGYLRGHERNIQQARYLAFWHVTGRGVEYDLKYVEDIEAITARDVMRVANKYFLEPTVVVLTPPQTAEAAPASN